MNSLPDYTTACLETGYRPNDAAAPAVFAEMACILRSAASLRTEMEQAVQSVLSMSPKGRRVKRLDKAPKPYQALGLALAA